ncbi:MAG: transporter substrate-binding domain-containing protein [Burkholderiaceae bacterium]|nr:transporter substrate-binding domain-containing protein [Burkholderiaceae bacterium]
MKIRVFLSACLLAFSFQARAMEPLRFCYQDVPIGYWTRPDGTGIALDLLRKVEMRLGERFIYSHMPWKRCLEEVRVGAMDGVIGAADAPERHAYTVYPTSADGSIDTRTALWTDVFNVFYRADSKVSWDGKELIVPGGVVLTQRGYAVADTLRQKGFKVAEPTKAVEESLRYLAQGSIEAAVLQGADAAWLRATDARFRDSIRRGSVPYAVYPLYLLPGRIAYERDSKRMQAIWNEIHAVRESAEYRKLEEGAARTYRGN